MTSSKQAAIKTDFTFIPHAVGLLQLCQNRAKLGCEIFLHFAEIRPADTYVPVLEF